MLADAGRRRDATSSAPSATGDNAVYLHRDARADAAQRKRAWAAWNVMQGDDPAADLCVTYWMNALQGIDPSRPLFVTLNPPRAAAPRAHLRAFQLRPSAVRRRRDRRAEAPARDPGPQPHLVLRRLDAATASTRTGSSSGLAVAEALGGTVPWRQAPDDAGRGGRMKGLGPHATRCSPPPDERSVALSSAR